MTLAAGKIWGFDITLLETNKFQMHEIQFRQGGVCSEHMHTHRYNAFYIIHGSLLIRVWNNDDAPDLIELHRGQMVIVPPGIYHQFEALSDGAAIEIYWADDSDPKDIVRRTRGFKQIPVPEVVH
jgi:quercetin dioxygenase-like cupin family protein